VGSAGDLRANFRLVSYSLSLRLKLLGPPLGGLVTVIDLSPRLSGSGQNALADAHGFDLLRLGSTGPFPK
jgi:hypothetical protein